MKKTIMIVPYVILILFFTMILVFGSALEGTSNRLQSPNTKELTGFTYKNVVIDTLPEKFIIPEEQPITIHNRLTSVFDDAQTLLFRTSLQNITVYLDGVVIYQLDYEEETNYASMWHIVHVPAGSEGSLLEVTYRSPFEEVSGYLNPVFYGESGSLTRSVFLQYIHRLVIGLFTVAIGLGLMIVSLFLYRKQSTANVYLGLFAVLLGVWIVSESRLMQLFTGNVFVIGSLSYVSLSMMMVPLLIYISIYMHKTFQYVLRIFSLLFFLYVPLIVLMELLNFAHFFESVIVTQVLILVSMIVCIVFLVIEKVKHQNQAMNEIMQYIVVLIVFGGLEIIVFFRSDFMYTSFFLTIGVALVMVMVTYNYIHFLINRFKLSYKNEFYQYLAYHDPITEAKNRLAFEQDFDQFFEQGEELPVLRLLYFDLDNLKFINDVHGHLEGDKVIKEGHKIIDQTFGAYGEIYRIGGDEFACLTTLLTDQLFEELAGEMINLVQAQNQVKPYHFGLSLGMAIYEEDDEIPEDLILRADHEMYENKDLNKKGSKKNTSQS